MRARSLEHFVERLLVAGLVLSAALLLAGLAFAQPAWLSAGLVILMATPGLRVIVVTVALAAQRDYPFAALSLAALAVLVTSAAIALLG